MSGKKALNINSLILIVLFLISSCSGKIDKNLNVLIDKNNLRADFVTDSEVTDKNVADLGGDLFFSADLSIDGSVSCASCHHPDKAGADGISLPIGIGGVDSKNVGQARIDAAEKNNSGSTLEGLIPRNTPTVINAALYRQNLFWDGRLQYSKETDILGKKTILTGFGVAQYNPSNYYQKNLLQTQARLPMTSAFEMKGGLVSQKNNHEIEQSVIAFLKTNPLWCEKFTEVFKEADCSKAISLDNLTSAIGEFEASLIFTNSPFEKYIRGEKNALSEKQKLGAIGFLTKLDDGGFGCVECHSGKAFSNEKFYNINIPASGRGANDAGWDLGRNNVNRAENKFSFRVPNLLNIALTAPYLHNGSALTLEDAILHHVVNGKDKRKTHVKILEEVNYAYITKSIEEEFTKNSQAEVKYLPKTLSPPQVENLVAFLESLTDPCLEDKVCLEKITKSVIVTPRVNIDSSLEDEASKQPLRILKKESLKSPVMNCANKQSKQNNKDQKFSFSVSTNSGIKHQRQIGLIHKGWLIDVVNYAGVSAMDVDYDCLDDLVFDAGKQGLIFYKQMPDGSFVQKKIPVVRQDDDVNPMIMDIDGDYKFDLFVGNLGKELAYIAFDFLNSNDINYRNKPVGPVVNATIADVDQDGDMDLTLALWRSFNTLRQEHIWMNDGNGNLSEQGKLMDVYQDPQNRRVDEGEFIQRVTPLESGAADLTFTPNYADIDGDGDDDLLLAADFFRSQVLKNENENFVDITDKNVIDDNNGMGAAVADFDNDGDMDWFVSSVRDSRFAWINGHRLYINDGKGVFSNKNIGGKDEWSWGSCAKDFNNDGWVDLFYVSGFGEFLKTATYEVEPQKKANEIFFEMVERFSRSTPVMLINDGKGGFIDQSKSLGFSEIFNGRGISCFDYQQDGDIDVIVTPLEGTPRLYKNNVNGSKNWLAIRFIGLIGNTEAIGTKVHLYTDKGVQYRQVMFENNYISRNPAQIHFGLGDATKIEKIVIDFPEPNKKNIVVNNLKINELNVVKLADYLK